MSINPSGDYHDVIVDFNEIAMLGEAKWNHNNCYFDLLAKFVPCNAEICLDIGCGKGELSLLIAQKSKKVIAVDIADQMIAYAKTHNAGDNIEYACANVLDMNFTDASLDLIITTATAHHLPYDWLLDFAKSKLKRGGRLVILDLAKAAAVSDYLLWGSAFIPNLLMNLLKNGRLQKDDAHAKAVWEAHGQHDVYMTMSEIRQLAAKHLPGAVIRRKLFWRYTLIWENS